MGVYPFAAMDREYQADVEELRSSFATVNPDSPASLREWFRSHPYLTTNDLCQIAQVCPRTVQRWKRRAGLPGLKRTPPRRWQLRPIPPAAPADWKSGTWLQQQYRLHSIRTIARAVDRSYRTIRRELQRRGVRFRTPHDAVRSRHPFRDRAWLECHYIDKGQSLSHCARLARVSTSTMTGWLLQFGIRIRTASEQLWWTAQQRREEEAGRHRHGN